MILFQKEHIKPILEGKKTQTRRLWKKPRVKVGSIHKAKVRLFDKKCFAKLRILDIWRHNLWFMSLKEVRAEGYDSREEFYDAFCKINKIERDIEKGIIVWAVEFEVVNFKKELSQLNPDIYLRESEQEEMKDEFPIGWETTRIKCRNCEIEWEAEQGLDRYKCPCCSAIIKGT